MLSLHGGQGRGATAAERQDAPSPPGPAPQLAPTLPLATTGRAVSGGAGTRGEARLPPCTPGEVAALLAELTPAPDAAWTLHR